MLNQFVFTLAAIHFCSRHKLNFNQDLTLLHCYITGAGVYHYNANNRLLWPAKESMLLYPLVAIAEVGKVIYNANDAVKSAAEGGVLIFGCRSLPGR